MFGKSLNQMKKCGQNLRPMNNDNCGKDYRIYIYDDVENTTSKSHDPRTLLMAPAQQEETIFVEGTGVVPAKCSPKIKSELFSLL